ncbi:transcription initiation factor IIB-like, partial [Malus domestica]|uniref:transcription initiation factor IIB-like n=1 Tax=Malus domestica TaxID=3750 RepID=UPI0039765EA5
FLACQENHNSQTPNEIAKAPNGPSRKEINKMVKLLEKELEIGSKATDDENLWGRYCSNLGMNSIRDRNAVEETLKNLKKFGIRRSPASVVATILYMIALRLSNGKTIEDVHQVTDVAMGTIRSTYKDILAFLVGELQQTSHHSCLNVFDESKKLIGLECWDIWLNFHF